MRYQPPPLYDGVSLSSNNVAYARRVGFSDPTVTETSEDIIFTQFFQDILGASSSGPTRFAIQISDGVHKLFNYFPVGKGDDVGLSLHDYWDSSYAFQKRLPAIKDIPPSQRFVSGTEYAHRALEFSTQKVDFHDSGVIAIKDSIGARMSKDRDAKSIAFADIPDSIKLCHLYPASFSEYPKADSSDGKTYNFLHLTEDGAQKPLRIEIHLCRSQHSSRFESKLIADCAEFASYRDKYTLEKSGLSIYTVFMPSVNLTFNQGHVTYIDLWEFVPRS